MVGAPFLCLFPSANYPVIASDGSSRGLAQVSGLRSHRCLANDVLRQKQEALRK